MADDQLSPVLAALNNMKLAADGGVGLVEAHRISGLQRQNSGGLSLVIEVPEGLSSAAIGQLEGDVKAALSAINEANPQIIITRQRAAAAETVRVTRAGPGRATGSPKSGMSGGTSLINGRPAHVHTIIAISSAKGGVGKSSIAANLACAFARLGLNTGLLDADVFGPSLPTMFGVVGADPKIGDQGQLIPIEAHGVKLMSIGFMTDPEQPMIWRGPMAASALLQMLTDVAWGTPEAPLDILLIDLPPGTGDIQLTMAQKVALNGAIIVSTPQEMALADVRRGAKMFAKTHTPILGLVENMAYYIETTGLKVHLFGEGGTRRLAHTLDLPFLGDIPLLPTFGRALDSGAPGATKPDAPETPLFLALAEQIIGQLAAGPLGKAPPSIDFID